MGAAGGPAGAGRPCLSRCRRSQAGGEEAEGRGRVLPGHDGQHGRPDRRRQAEDLGHLQPDRRRQADAGPQGGTGRLPRQGRRLHHQGLRPERRPRRHSRPSEDVPGGRRRRHAGARQPGALRRGPQDQVEHGQQDAAHHLPGGRRPAAHGLHGRREVSGDVQEGGRDGNHHQHHPVRRRSRLHEDLEGHRGQVRGEFRGHPAETGASSPSPRRSTPAWRPSTPR